MSATIISAMQAAMHMSMYTHGNDSTGSHRLKRQCCTPMRSCVCSCRQRGVARRGNRATTEQARQDPFVLQSKCAHAWGRGGMLGAARGWHGHGTIEFCDSLSRPTPVGGRRRPNVAPLTVGMAGCSCCPSAPPFMSLPTSNLLPAVCVEHWYELTFTQCLAGGRAGAWLPIAAQPPCRLLTRLSAACDAGSCPALLESIFLFCH